MAQQLYFSRDTRMFVQFRNTTDNTEDAADLGKGALWEIPVLDGYSFSQTTNTSEITLAEMESTAGVSRRGRRMFTDSLAPAEFSFSTYIRPFDSVGQNAIQQYDYNGVKAAELAAQTGVHSIEEVLWASMCGADKYVANGSKMSFRRNVNPVSGSETDVITPTDTSSTIVFTESNRSALHSFTVFFLIDTAASNPLVYRLPEAIINEVTVDFDVDGIATLNWSGFAKEVQDHSQKVCISSIHNPLKAAGNAGDGDGSRIDDTALVLGDIVIDTGNSRAVSIVSDLTNANAVATQAIDEATTSTKNFIRNRLTAVSIEAADAADKVAGTFPGQHAVISAVDVSGTTDKITTSTAHNFTTGDQVQISGITGAAGTAFDLNGTWYVNVTSTTQLKLYDSETNATNGTGTGLKDLDALNAGATLTGSTIGNGKYSLTLTGGSFNIGNNITYLVPEELGAINKPLEHVTGTRTAGGNATCYMTLEDTDTSNGTSRQFFNDLVGTGAMSKVVNKFKVIMHIGGTAATGNTTDPAVKVTFPTAHIEVPTHQVEDVISLETTFTALPTDFGAADEITNVVYYPPSTY
tara:strand:+ start:3155 stop:4894 length:1740 start_codon:yes stop_codon:yes gene_type:complete